VLLAPPKQATAVLAAVRPRAQTDRLARPGVALSAPAVALRPEPLTAAAMETVDQRRAAGTGRSQRWARLRQQRSALPLAAGPVAAAITARRQQHTARDRPLAAPAPAAAGSLVAARDGVPGIGPVTAAAVASGLRPKQFGHPEHCVAWSGVDVRVRDSGSATAGSGVDSGVDSAP
jgi:transposase